MAPIYQLVRAHGEDPVWRAALLRGRRIFNVRFGPIAERLSRWRQGRPNRSSREPYFIDRAEPAHQVRLPPRCAPPRQASGVQAVADPAPQSDTLPGSHHEFQCE